MALKQPQGRKVKVTGNNRRLEHNRTEKEMEKGRFGETDKAWADIQLIRVSWQRSTREATKLQFQFTLAFLNPFDIPRLNRIHPSRVGSCNFFSIRFIFTTAILVHFLRHVFRLWLQATDDKFNLSYSFQHFFSTTNKVRFEVRRRWS